MLDAAKRVQLLVRGDGRVKTFKADPGAVLQLCTADATPLWLGRTRGELLQPAG